MKIEAVHIKNYKSLRDVSLKELGNLVILIGANSSGKSNFLEILNRFFAEIDLTGTPTGIDTYSWFDGNVDERIEVSMTLKLDDKDCNEIFPPEILKLVKERFGERYQELSVCRWIVKHPTGWQTKSIEWAGIPLFKEEKYISVEELAKSLSVKYIPLEDLQAVFFAPGATNVNITGDRLILIKSIKKAYYMGPYADELVRGGRVKWVNVSEKTTDWRKYASEEGYSLVEQALSEEHLRPEIPWLGPQLASEITSRITTKLKGQFRLVLAVRNSPPQNPLQRAPFLDSETQLTLRDLGISEERPKQKRWSRIEKIFNELTKQRLGPHPTHPHLRVMEEDLALPIQYRGGGEQELLFLLRFLTEDRQIFGIEEPELHTHPQLARQIFHLFKDFSKEKQIFIATHSTAFVDQADIDTTWIVRKEGKETIITRIKKPEELRNLLFELGVKPSDIFFSEAVIFVEGESERIVYPILAEKLDVNLRSPRISIIPTWGKNRGKYYLNVWIEASKSANIPYFMIFDREAGEDKEIKQFVGKKFLVENENLFILKKGSIEDYYPRDKLIEAIQSEYQMELSEKDKEDILRIPRARNIETLLKDKGKEVRGWKVRVGKKVAESMRADEIDDEIKRIMERLRTKLGT